MNLLKFLFVFFTFNFATNFNVCHCIVNRSSSTSSLHNFNCKWDSNENSSTEIVQGPTITFGINRAPNGTTEKRIITRRDFTSIQCSFSKPIEWAFYSLHPLNFNNDGFTTANNYFGVVKDPGNVSVTIYEADLDLIYNSSEIESLNMIIACEAVRETRNQCERSYLKYNPESTKFDTIHQPSLPAVRRKVVPPSFNTNRECKATLLIQQAEENRIIYKWEPIVNNSTITNRKHFVYNNPVSFWNAMKDLENDYECWKYTSTIENCTENCNSVSYSTFDNESENITSNAIAFYAEINGVPLVLKGLFSIQKENNFLNRKFLMVPNVTFSDMMYLDLPFQVMYTEKEYLVTCWVSAFYFAVGTIITVDEDPMQEILKNGTRKLNEEFNKHNSSRMVTRTIKFPSEFANTIQSVMCLAPKLHSTDWHMDSKFVYIENSSFPEFVDNPETEVIAISEELDINFTISSNISKPFISSFRNLSCKGDSNENSNSEIVPKPVISFGINRAPNGTIEKRSTQKELTNLQCSFTKPIQWVFYTPNPFNFVKDKLSTANNYFGRVVNASGTIYQADLEIFYFRSEMKSVNITVACESSQSEYPCEKSYLRYNHVSSKFDLPDQPSFPVIRIKTPSYNIKRNCNATLLIHKTEENQIIYKWETLNNSKISKTKHFVYNNPVSFWNAFKDLENDFECWDYSSKLENCTEKDCKRINYSRFDASVPETIISNAVTFYAEINGARTVLKGLFSIGPGNDLLKRKFLMVPHVNFSNMMHLDLPFEVELGVMYTEKEYLVTCWVSTFFFAVGTIISLNEDPMEEILTNGTGKMHEVYNNKSSSRMVTRTITFTSEYANRDQNLTCFAPKIHSPDWHKDYRSVYVEHSSFPEFIGLYSSFSEFIGFPGDELTLILPHEAYFNGTISCAFQGVPTPNISWELPTPVIAELEKFVTIVTISLNETENIYESVMTFSILMKNFTGGYKCTGANFRGNVTKTFSISFTNELSYALKLSLGISIGAAMLIFLAVILLLVRRLRIEERLFRIQAEQLMKDFRDGCTVYSKDIFDAHFSILKQPYNTEYEVPIERWSIGNRVLGSGEFGIVKQGTVQIENAQIKVAIKTTKHTPDIADFKGFLDELKIMAYIGVHDNIVSLVAAFSDDNNARNILIGVEFCDNGSLLDYVTARKGAFQNMVTPEGCLTTDFNEKTIEQAKAQSPELTTANLYTWSYQIASGLEYLEQKNVLHSDLATRNVLLSAQIEAKISDFGLSKILQNAENYTKKTRCPLPWKWMAIESLRDMEFSTHSDMWAFGVTLWELYTLCENPWADQSWSVEFTVELINGRRLPKPFGATNNIYNRVMLPAWHPVPQQRLLPADAKEFFRNVLEGSFKDG